MTTEQNNEDQKKEEQELRRVAQVYRLMVADAKRCCHDCGRKLDMFGYCFKCDGDVYED